MANEFVGLSVEVQLSNGLIVSGIVADINQKSQQLILHNATININNIKQFSKMYTIQNTDIKDLQLTSDKKINNVNTNSLTSPTSNYSKLQVPPPQAQAQPQLASSAILSPRLLPMYGSSTNLNPSLIPMNNILPLGGIPPAPNSTDLNSLLFKKGNNNTDVTNNTVSQTKPYMVDDEDEDVLRSPITKQNSLPYADPAIVSYSQQISDNNSDATSNSTQKILSTTLNSYSSKKNNSKINESNNDEDDLVDYDYSRNSQRKYKKKNQKSYFNSLKEQRSSAISSNYSSKGNSKYNTSPGRQRKGRRAETNQWANGDVNLYKDEEFDFQGNLGLFDKKKEWAKIRETNNIAPETLLVNLNKIKKDTPSPYRHRHRHSSGDTDGHPYYENSQVKLGIHENVLDSVASETDSEYESSNEDETSQSKISGISKSSRIIFENSSGVVIPSLTESQASLLEHLTANEYGIKEEITIENAGRDIAMMVIQALGGNRRINVHNHNSAPFVVILAGNNKSGAYAINAAKHLLNHECQVLVCLAATEDDVINMVAYQKRIFTLVGGKCIYQASNLPTKAVDIIVDGILGASQYLDNIRDENQRECIMGMMEWANGIQTPVVSLECPSGIHPNTGEIIDKNHYIRTKWTLALGLPRRGLTDGDLTGGILLGDIGIPKTIYKTLGLKPSYHHPFADKYLTSIELLK